MASQADSHVSASRQTPLESPRTPAKGLEGTRGAQIGILSLEGTRHLFGFMLNTRVRRKPSILDPLNPQSGI